MTVQSIQECSNCDNIGVRDLCEEYFGEAAKRQLKHVDYLLGNSSPVCSTEEMLDGGRELVRCTNAAAEFKLRRLGCLLTTSQVQERVNLTKIQIMATRQG